MLVRGALSDVVTDAIAQEFAELVPGARVLVVRRAAHMVAGDDNASFTDAVLSFLEALPARPR
jgi:pimeloyl-ACP methyl ester carboxylesterase